MTFSDCSLYTSLHSFKGEIIMKKLFVAATIVASAAAAHAQVSVYGTVDQVLANTKTGGDSVSGLTSNASRIGFKATEQLGGGLSARAVIETSILSNDPTGGTTSLGDRQSTVGLANKFGSVDLGRATHSTYNTLASADPFGGLFGSVAGDVHNFRGTRLGSAMFVNVAPIAGVGLSFDRGTENGANPYSVAASTTVAGVKVGASRFENTVAGTKSDVVSAATTLGPVATQVAVSYSSNVDAGVKSHGTLVGVTQPLAGTPVTLKASYGETNTDVKAYSLGAGYALSKRTSVDAYYRNVNKAGSAQDVAQVGFGIRHAF